MWGYLALANLRQGERKFAQACDALEQAHNLALAHAPLLAELGEQHATIDRFGRLLPSG